MWGCAVKKHLNKIEKLQKKYLRNVANKSYTAHTQNLFLKVRNSNYAGQNDFQ